MQLKSILEYLLIYKSCETNDNIKNLIRDGLSY
jgi:hypothetical protein